MSARSLTVGLVQMCAGTDIATNLAAVREATLEAASRGARVVLTPEGTNLLQRDRTRLRADLLRVSAAEQIATLGALAQEAGVWLVVGSLILPDAAVSHPSADAGEAPLRALNRCHVFAPSGELTAWYDKIHLFDVDLGAGETYRESATFTPGDRAVLTRVAGARVGLSICYDVRFAGLYRALAQEGAEVLTVPAAFTVPTGRAHWEVLLRARAIETGAWVLAPAQAGVHADGRSTWGHSLIIDPWGGVVAQSASEGPELMLATLDLDASVEARRRIPALRHDRSFLPPAL